MTSCLKIKAYRSEKYRAFLRSKPSLYSGMIGSESDPIIAAHQGLGKKGTALKSPDIYAVPLLWSEHQQFEHQKGGKTFWGNQFEALPLRCLEYVNEFLQLGKK